MHWDANLWEIAEWKLIKRLNLPITGGWGDTPEPQQQHYNLFTVGGWGRGPLIQLWSWVWRSLERSWTSVCLFIVAFKALSAWTLKVQTVQTESQGPQSSWQNLAEHHHLPASVAWPLWKHADSADLLPEQPCFGSFTAQNSIKKHDEHWKLLRPRTTNELSP